MNAKILPRRCTLAMRRSALAAIGISFCALSATTLGADLRTTDRSAVATAPAGRQVTPARPTIGPAIKAKNTSEFVDRLYKELTEWTRLGARRRQMTGYHAATVNNLRSTSDF